MTKIKNFKGKFMVDDPTTKKLTLEEKINYFAGIYNSTSEDNEKTNMVLVSNKQFDAEQEVAGLKIIPVRYVQQDIFYVGNGEILEDA
jgi:hypothetical protein